MGRVDVRVHGRREADVRVGGVQIADVIEGSVGGLRFDGARGRLLRPGVTGRGPKDDADDGREEQNQGELHNAEEVLSRQLIGRRPDRKLEEAGQEGERQKDQRADAADLMQHARVINSKG